MGTYVSIQDVKGYVRLTFIFTNQRLITLSKMGTYVSIQDVKRYVRLTFIFTNQRLITFSENGNVCVNTRRKEICKTDFHIH